MGAATVLLLTLKTVNFLTMAAPIFFLRRATKVFFCGFLFEKSLYLMLKASIVFRMPFRGEKIKSKSRSKK